MKKIFILFAISVAYLSFAFVAHAQTAETLPIQTLSISPIIQDLSLKPGETHAYDVTITNNADTPIGIHINVEPLPVSQLPDYTIYNNSDSLSFLSWVTLSKNDILLPEHSQQVITVTVAVPKNQKNSGYYAALEYVPFFSQQEKVNEPIVLTHVIGLLFTTIGNLNYDNLEEKAHIVSFEPLSWVFENMQATLRLSVGNDYFTHFSAKPFLTLTPLFGKPTTMLLEEKHVLPGSARNWLETIALKKYTPLYFVHIAVSVGNGNIITKDTFFILLPYHILESIGIAMLLIFVVLFRKRLMKALIVFFRHES